MTTRRRLWLVALATLAVGVGAVVIVGNLLLGLRVRAETSSLLRARADGIAATIAVRSGRLHVRATRHDQALDHDAWVLDQDRVVERPAGVDPRLETAALTLGRARSVAEADAPGDMRLRVQPVRAAGRRVGSVVVGTSTAPLEALRQEVLVGSIVLAALVLLAGGLALRGAIDGAWRPVAEMTAIAEDWSEHDLERRFDLGAPRDELTGLAATLDGLLTRIAASRRHERRFADDVAHELRTPVASLRMHASLGLAVEQDAQARASLRGVLGEADRLSHTIDTLLEVGRRELDGDTYVVDLAALAAEVPDAAISDPGDLPPAEGEADLVRRAIAPLVENARRHARTRIRLELSHGHGRVELAVRDDGPGVPPRLGDRAFEPGVGENGSGAGLGLPLARRLARSCGGDVRLGPGPGGCFVLSLPAFETQSGERQVPPATVES
jgi:signal transduction histidine kinase